jgi:hypothetical protein
MRMEARMANAHDELLPAMRTAVERVDDKVDKVAATVSAMAEELAWLREHVQSVVPSGSAASTVALPLASEQVSQQVPHMRQPTKDASPPQDFIASCGAADAATHSNIAVGFQMAPEAPPDPERMRQLRRNLAGPQTVAQTRKGSRISCPRCTQTTLGESRLRTAYLQTAFYLQP